jgi:hypothetical protein
MKFLPIHTEALRYFGYTEEESIAIIPEQVIGMPRNTDRHRKQN